MQLVAKYRLYAEQCRELAAKMHSPELKQLLATMAGDWEAVGTQREAELLEQIDGRSGIDQLV